MDLAAGGHALIVVSGHNLVSVNLNTGQTRRLFTAPFEIEQLAGPPGHFLAIADRETIAIVDLRDDTMHVVAHADASNNAVNGIMSASASTLLIASTGQTKGRGELLPLLTALNVDTGARWTVPLAVPPRIADVVYLRVSPDGRTWYVTGSTLNAEHEEQVAATWAIDPRTRKVRWLANGPAGTYGSPVQVSPDGRLVAVGYGNGEAAVLEAATGHQVALDSSHSTVASGDLAIAADDKTLVTLSLDGLIRLWSAQGSERLRLQAPPETTLSFAPEGEDLLLFGSRGELINTSGETVRSFPGVAGFTSCASCFSATPGLGLLTYLDPNSKEPRVIEIDGRTGRQVAAVTVQRLEAQGVAPDGDIAADYVEDNRLEVELVDPHNGAVRRFAPGVTETGCTSGPPSFNASGSLMAISDGCVRVDVWDVRSGSLIKSIMLPEHGSSSALMTPDGRYVLVQIAVGTFARADLRSGAVEEVPGAQAASSALAVSPNGRYYAIGRQDGSVDEYDARTLRLIRQHELDSPIKTLVFSPDSSELAVEDTSDVVRVWDSCEICENPTQLARRAAAESVRSLTASERATFGVH
jgi:WD40 repeat protein